MKFNLKTLLCLAIFSLIFILESCKQSKISDNAITLDVTATAYNTTEAQTKKGNDGIAAWGDTLVPGEKAIAVSRDLIKMGLTHNKPVFIEGFDGVYLVKDKMNKRYEKRIDIYMGLDIQAAKNWGKQTLKITFDTIN